MLIVIIIYYNDAMFDGFIINYYFPSISTMLYQILWALLVSGHNYYFTFDLLGNPKIEDFIVNYVGFHK